MTSKINKRLAAKDTGRDPNGIPCDYCKLKVSPDTLTRNPKTNQMYCISCTDLMVRFDRKD